DRRGAATHPRRRRRGSDAGGHAEDGLPVPEAGARVPPPLARGRPRSHGALPAAAGAAAMTAFPSVAWFQRLAEAMAAQPEKYRKLGPLDLTLIVRVLFPDGRENCTAVSFEGTRCTSVARLQQPSDVRGRHPVIIEGDHAAWKEMIESIRAHGGADGRHTLNYLTLPDWPR